MATVSELLAAGSDQLVCDAVAVDCDADAMARREAEVFLCAALEKPRSYLYAWPEAEVSAQAEDKFRTWVAQRSGGAPVAYLLGEREFWSLPLEVSPATLIPRPDTEHLVEWALELKLSADAAVADLGTGSGAIALALASERPDWVIHAVDVSAPALELARRNAKRHSAAHVFFFEGHWFAPLPLERYSLIVSNPPYLAEDDPHLARDDLRFEPREALVAGDDGMADFSAIIGGASRRLHSGGWLMLEHGNRQGEQVRKLLRAAGFSEVDTRRDLAGHERVSCGCRPMKVAAC